jgi:tetratricopeptide (TPR) repeat protein
VRAEKARDAEVRLQGLLHVHNRSWREAADTLGKVTGSFADDAEVWLGLAQAYGQLDRPPDAVAAFSRVLDRDADNVTARLGRAEQYAALRRLNEAVADYAAAFRREPNLPAHAAGYARVLHEHTSGWTVLEPVELTSAGGATLTRLSDGSVLAGGKNPDHDTYTFVARTDLAGITGLRIEALPHPSLPGGGCGRAMSPSPGDFLLTELTLSAAAGGQNAQPVAFGHAWSDILPGTTPGSAERNSHRAIDGDPQTGWSTRPRQAQPHLAVFLPREPVGRPGGEAADGGGHGAAAGAGPHQP